MDLTAIQDEVKARGFAFASTTRLNYWINAAYRKALEKEAWPFLEVTVTGASPLTPSPELRAIYTVVDTSTKTPLEFADVRTLMANDPTLIETGTPYCWYQFGSNNVSAYPTSAATSLSVKGLKVATDLSSGSDTPLIPTRYQYDILVEGACSYAYRDSDNAEMAKLCRDSFDEALLDMGDALLVPNYGNPRSMVVLDDGVTVG